MSVSFIAVFPQPRTELNMRGRSGGVSLPYILLHE